MMDADTEMVLGIIFRLEVRHCNQCGGDGIDRAVKDETGNVARGECAVPCGECGGTGHVITEGRAL